MLGNKPGTDRGAIVDLHAWSAANFRRLCVGSNRCTSRHSPLRNAYGRPWSLKNEGIPEHQGAHIVIVDDLTANLKLYAKLAAGLEPNVSVHSFNDPRKALEWLGDNAADLVISDYKMPTMHGAEFTRHVRRVPTCPDVPVVVVTAYADHDFQIEALEAGASDFLRSPVDYLEFQTRARNLVRLGRHQRLMRDRAFTLEHELKESKKSRDQLLRDSREWLAQVIDTVPAMVSATDTQGDRIFVNAYQSAVLGAIDRRPDGRPDVERLDRQVLASGKALDGFEETLTDEVGDSRTFLTVKSPLRDADGKTVGVLTTSLDITERKRAEAQLVYQAQHDHLTSLPNRAHLYDRLRRELEARRASGQVFALHFLDLDRFKVRQRRAGPPFRQPAAAGGGAAAAGGHWRW